MANSNFLSNAWDATKRGVREAYEADKQIAQSWGRDLYENAQSVCQGWGRGLLEPKGWHLV